MKSIGLVASGDNLNATDPARCCRDPTIRGLHVRIWCFFRAIDERKPRRRPTVVSGDSRRTKEKTHERGGTRGRAGTAPRLAIQGFSLRSRTTSAAGKVAWRNELCSPASSHLLADRRRRILVAELSLGYIEHDLLIRNRAGPQCASETCVRVRRRAGGTVATLSLHGPTDHEIADRQALHDPIQGDNDDPAIHQNVRLGV